MRASILISSYNEGDLLGKTLASCQCAAVGLECEILVSDNGSTDGSVAQAEAAFPDVTFIVDGSTRGPSPTKHRAAVASGGSTLVFLDGHCRIERDSLERMVADVEEQDGQAAIVPRMFDLEVSNWSLYSCQRAVCQRLDLETLEQPTFARQRLFQQRGRYVESAGLIGCSFAMSRDHYFHLRGCDPDMRVWGSDDADLGLKSWLMGYPVLADPEVHVGHRFRAAVDPTPIMADLLANRLRMARKNFSEGVWLDWLERFHRRHDEETAAAALAVFESRRRSVEEEREYLMAHRKCDEFWFAKHFGLRWPRASRADTPT